MTSLLLSLLLAAHSPSTAPSTEIIQHIVHYREHDSGDTPAPPPVPDTSPQVVTRYFFTIDLNARYQIMGTGEISAEQAASANCYAITLQGDLIERIDYLCASHPALDPLFHVQRIDFEYLPGIERRWYRNAQGQSVTNSTGVYGEELILNPSNCISDVINLDDRGARTNDNNGVIHYLRTLDATGRVISTERIGLLGSPIKDNQGNYTTRSVYDSQDHRIEYDNFDANNLPLNNKEGVAVIRDFYIFNPDSTQIDESYFDATELPVEEASTGIHQRTRIYDRRGLLLSESYYDRTGAPTLDNTYRISEQRHVYDENGNELSDQFFGVDGKPKNNKDTGVARIDYLFDDHNRVVEKDFYGDDGKLTADRAIGVAVIRQEYDDEGFMCRRLFYDSLRDPTAHLIYGAPAIRIQVDGGTTSISLRDDHDQPTENPIGGYASFSYFTAKDSPLTATNIYYDLQGRRLSSFRVHLFNPYLALLRSYLPMQLCARLGILAAWLGCLLGLVWNCVLIYRLKFRTPWREIALPLLTYFLLGEGLIFFTLSVWWAYTTQYFYRIGITVYLLAALYFLFFAYRFFNLGWPPRPTKKALSAKSKTSGLLPRYSHLIYLLFYGLLSLILSYLLWEMLKR